MARVVPLSHTLEEICPVPWNEATEGNLHHDYPFPNQENLDQENLDQDFVIRRYLETLWLPESFNPLSYLIHSLRRFGKRPSSEPHPLHSFLEPVLLSTRAASDKYRTELVQILADGGGAGEQEEMMMWYVYELEKAENEEDGAIDEEKWRKGWLERLERREVMIQTLLLMLKISLPPLKTLNPEKTIKKKNKAKEQTTPETTETRLESYMDKLAVWQLTGTLGTSQLSSQSVNPSRLSRKDELHWTQVFYEDVVAPLFKLDLPVQCEMLRSKLYPEQSVSDNEESEAESLLNGVSRSGSRAPSVARVSSFSQSTAPQSQRSRSKSLSVSLAQDEASQRASIVGSKQSLSREVSMSRILREKPKVHGSLVSSNDSRKPESDKRKAKRDIGMTLIQETPAKSRYSGLVRNTEYTWNSRSQRSGSQFSVPSPPPTSSSEPGDICIEDTPIASRVRLSEEWADSMSPLTPLQDEAPTMTTSAAENARARGRKASSLKTSRLSSRKSYRIQCKPQPTVANRTRDEHADGSFVESFKLSKVTLLESDDSHAMLVSPTPLTRTIKGGFTGTGDKVKRVGLFGKSSGGVEIETPTKARKRRR